MQSQTLDYSSTQQSEAQVVRALPMVIGIAAAAGGITLRWASLGSNSLWFDEGYTAWAIDHPVMEIVRIIKADTAPPLYYILLHGWTTVFGRSETALRSMSALAGSISVLVFAAIAGRMLKSGWGKASAIGLFSMSFMQIACCHDARFYSMMTMMGAIDLYLVLLLCERKNVWLLTASALVWIASMYTNNMMIVYLGCLGISWLVLPGKRPFNARIKDLLIVSTIAGIAFLPWVPALLGQSKRIQTGFWPSAPDGYLLARTISVLSGVHENSLPAGDWWFYLIDTVILGVTAIGCTAARSWRAALGLMIFGLLPIGMVFIYSLYRQPIFMERAFVATGVVIPLLIGLSMEVARSRVARAMSIAVIVMLAFMGIASLPIRWRGEHAEQWREACAYVDEQQSPGVQPRLRRMIVCVANEGEIMYDYYARHSDYSPRADLVGVPRSFFALSPPQTMQRVQNDKDLDSFRAALDSGTYDEIVVIASHSWWGDHDERALALLTKNYRKTAERQFNQIKVFRFRGTPGL